MIFFSLITIHIHNVTHTCTVFKQELCFHVLERHVVLAFHVIINYLGIHECVSDILYGAIPLPGPLFIGIYREHF